jgi:hypothetical protein
VSDLRPRLFRRDATLWPEGNLSASRLGFLEVPGRMEAQARDLVSWAASIDQGHVVLAGMGGASLGPAVLGAVAQAIGPAGERRLTVLDTTDPATIDDVDLSDAFFLVSSKSGTTLETRALLAYLWDRVPHGERYAAITDPGTPLAGEALNKGFARVFQNPTDVGGRFSVLSYFGMVPAALVGYDPEELCALAMEVDRDEAAELGRAVGDAALEGQDKLTVVAPAPFGSFGLWVEQLVAESTGKHGRGVVPVPTPEMEDGPDRYPLQVSLTKPADLGPAFYRFELAVAIIGHLIGVDPFDEPNVAESKRNTDRVLESLPLPTVAAVEPAEVPAFLEEAVHPFDYVSIQAYLPYGHDPYGHEALEALRRQVRDRLGGLAVTAGYGPRLLHSTGQLHKGGPNTVVALQVVARSQPTELAIPGFPYDFGTLLAAQAIGDHQSLLAHGRRVLRVAADDPNELREVLAG